MSNPSFPRGDNIGPMRRDAHRLAGLDVDDETRFAVLELRAQERGIALRSENWRDERRMLIVRQLLVDDQIVAMSGYQQILIGDHLIDAKPDPRILDDCRNKGPAVYRGPWSTAIQLIPRRRGEAWPEFEQCMTALAAFDEQDRMEANTSSASKCRARARRL